MVFSNAVKHFGFLPLGVVGQMTGAGGTPVTASEWGQV